jgi:DNA polymerase
MRAMPAENELREEGPDEPRRELERLATGLERHVRRRKAFGQRSASRSGRGRGSAPSSPPASSTETAMQEFASSSDAASGSSVASSGSSVADSGPARDAADVRRQAAAARDLDELRSAVAQCRACSLCQTRTQTVFMDGRGSRRVLFVGEAPGAEEDRRGVPFVGRAGQLLTDIITKGMGIAREEVLIANVLKCRPPDNRDPTTDEKATCTPWLDRQIELTDPAVVIPLGRHAAMHILGTTSSMGAMRGRIHERGGRKIVATFHPAYLLRNPADKKECWKDIQLAMGLLGIVPPPAKSAGHDTPS